MRYDPTAFEVTGLRAELLRDERALIAEGQRLVLHRGRELVDLCARAAGSAGELEADALRNQILWSRCPPDEWPLGTMIALLRSATDLSACDEMLRTDLLGALLRLARNADELHGLRARISELNTGSPFG